MTPKLLLIGLDGADWDLLRPLLDAGLTPNLERLMSRGAWGACSGLPPHDPAALATSVVTGKRPHEHGVLHASEPALDGSSVVPARSTTRRTKALWNIVSQAGLQAHLVAWPASHPVEPISGIGLSDRFSAASKPLDLGWPILPGSMHPADLSLPSRPLRIHPEDLDSESLTAFVPNLDAVDQDEDSRLIVIARRLAEASSVNAQARWILETQPWDFLAVSYGIIERLSEHFLAFDNRADDPDAQIYGQVVQGAYCFFDLMLGGLLAAAGENANVALVSSHGYRRAPPSETGAAAWQRRRLGPVVLSGPDIESGGRIYGASVLDVTPTALTLLGLPIGDDMPGSPWTQVLRSDDPPAAIPSWEDAPGPSSLHPPDRRTDPCRIVQTLQQQIDDGAIEPPPALLQEALETCARERRRNEATSLAQAGLHDRAIPIIEQLLVEAPLSPQFALDLAHAYRSTGASAKAKALIDPLIDDRSQPAPVLLALARDEIENRNPEAALEHLELVQQRWPDLPTMRVLMGSLLLRREKWSDALAQFGAALARDPDNPFAHRGLAVARLGQGRPQDAIDPVLTAIELAPHEPLSHYYLGVALTRLERPADAAKAFEHAISLGPGLLAARRRVSALYRHILHDPARAAHHMFESKRILERRRRLGS